MKHDLDAIERIAKAAQARSPGPWRRFRLGHGEVTPGGTNVRIDCIMDSSPKPEGFDDYDGGLWPGNRVLETDGGYYEPKEATAEYIAAVSPDVVLALVAKIREIEICTTMIRELELGIEERDKTIAILRALSRAATELRAALARALARWVPDGANDQAEWDASNELLEYTRKP